MRKFCFFSPKLAIISGILFSLNFGCSQPGINKYKQEKNQDNISNNFNNNSILGSTAVQCQITASDVVNDGLSKGFKAAILAQKASSPEDWNQVAIAWLQAIEKMQSIPISNPRRAFAQKKVIEYMQYLAVAQRKANINQSHSNLISFDSDLLDEQLWLYLSYIATVGPPDILIIGSSRSLQGIDPKVLNQVLSTQGKSNLKIFNFGVNGATAQVVDFIVRQLLIPDKLPKLIIWADGARAFNNGRPDRTFTAIANSPGYRGLATGTRPVLSPTKPEAREDCVTFQNINRKSIPITKIQLPEIQLPETPNKSKSVKSVLGQITISEVPENVIAFQNNKDLINAIDVHGFLPVDTRFNPNIYYSRIPRVAGRYDGDYANFSLQGKQEAALKSIVAFTREKKVPLVFVNLPLTQDYLDSDREKYEQQFRQFMQRQAREKGFVFRDLNISSLSRNEFFADPSHLNRFGAAAVSRQLGSDKQIPWPSK